MPTTERLFVFAAALTTLLLFLTNSSEAWFWRKTNTVKAYETCVSENTSALVDASTIRKKCIEKLAAPIPVDQIDVKYEETSESWQEWAEYKDANLYLNPVLDPYRNRSFTVRFSTKNFLLTGVSATVRVGSEAERIVSSELDSPLRSFAVQALPKDYPPKYMPPPFFTQCDDANPRCISIKIISAKGLEIAVE